MFRTPSPDEKGRTHAEKMAHRALCLFDIKLDNAVLRPLRVRRFVRNEHLGLVRVGADGVAHWLRLRVLPQGGVTLGGGIWPLYIPPVDRVAGPSRDWRPAGAPAASWAESDEASRDALSREVLETIERKALGWFDEMGSTVALAAAFADPQGIIRQLYQPPWDDYECGFIFLKNGQADYAQGYLESARDRLKAQKAGWAAEPLRSCEQALGMCARPAGEANAWLERLAQATKQAWKLVG